MGNVCFGRAATASPAQSTPPSIEPPKLVRRRSAPRPRASKQNIEAFYREGKELQRAEKEELERARLRTILQIERERLGYDEDAAYLKEALTSNNLPPLEETIVAEEEERRSVERQVLSERFPSFEPPASRPPIGLPAPPPGCIEPENAVGDVGLLTHTMEQRVPNLSTTAFPQNGFQSSEQDVIRYSSAFSVDEIHQSNIQLVPNIHRRLSLNSIISGLGSMQHLENLRLTSVSEPRLPIAPVHEDPVASTEETNCAEDNVKPSWEAEAQDSIESNTEKPSQMASSSNVQPESLIRDASVLRLSPLEQINTPQENLTSAELFSRIKTLVKPSVSTFVSLGSSSSLYLDKKPSTPTSDKTTIIHRISQGSLRQSSIRKRSSTGTLGISPTPQGQRYSSSSFYPSRETSRCQSLVASTLELRPFNEPYSATISMGGSNSDIPRRSYSLRHYKTAPESPLSPSLSNFVFPWNSPTGSTTAVVGTTGSIIVDTTERQTEGQLQRSRTMLALVPQSGERQQNGYSRVPVLKLQPRTSSTHATLEDPNHIGKKNISSATTEVISAATTTSSTITPQKYASANLKGTKLGLRAVTPVVKAIRPRMSWYNKTGSSSQDQERSGKETIEKAERASYSGDSPRRKIRGSQNNFIYEEGGLLRSRSMTLRKSFTASMAKLRNKVSMTGGRNFSQPASSLQAKDQGMPDQVVEMPRLRKHGGQQNREDLTNLNSSFDRIEPTKAMGLDEGKAEREREFGYNAAMIRRVNTVRSLPSRPERRNTTMSRPGFKRRNTTYDDCVIPPFGDGEDDSDFQKSINSPHAIIIRDWDIARISAQEEEQWEEAREHPGIAL